MRSICYGSRSHVRKDPSSPTQNDTLTSRQDHIVRLCSWAEIPDPRLYLEYMPLGNLDDQHKVAHFLHKE